MERAKELGAYAFLDKASDIDGLVRITKQALNKSKKVWEWTY